MQGKGWIAAVTIAVAAWAAPPAGAETVFGVTDGNDLVAFESTTPGVAGTTRDITGLAGGESIIAIDVRPATLQLYGFSSQDRLYRIDVATGAATAVGNAIPVDGGNIDIDFNPAVDRLRLVSDADENLRINPANGTLAGTDAALSYGPDTNPSVTGAAYTNNGPASSAYPNVPATQLFGIDSAADQVVEQAPPDAGTLVVKGPLGVDVSGDVGFDVATTSAAGTGLPATNTAYAVMRPVSDAKAHLYTINTESGAATDLGQLPSADQIRDIAVAPPVPVLNVLLNSALGQRIATLRADRPAGLSTGVGVSGLGFGERLLGIDRRPNGAGLYGISTASRVYQIDPTTGAATPVGTGPFTPAVDGETPGLDFNPIADRLRFVTETEQNLRIDQLTGTVAATDPAPAYAVGDPNHGDNPAVGAVAYTNPAFPAPDATTLFDIDTGQDVLAEQSLSTQELTTVGSGLGVDVGGNPGFEIVQRFNHGFAILNASLYAINASGPAGGAANGTATLIGDLGLPAGTTARGLAVLQESSPVPAPEPTATATPSATPTATGTPTPRSRADLSARVRPKRDTTRPYRFRVRGRLMPGGAVSDADGCNGRVGVKVARGTKSLVSRSARVKPGCRFARRVTVRRAGRRGKLTFRIRFRGNTLLKPRTIVRTARFGPR